MRVEIGRGGVMKICSESNLEVYALDKWLNDNVDNLTKADIDFCLYSSPEEYHELGESRNK